MFVIAYSDDDDEDKRRATYGATKEWMIESKIDSSRRQKTFKKIYANRIWLSSNAVEKNDCRSSDADDEDDDYVHILLGMAPR